MVIPLNVPENKVHLELNVLETEKIQRGIKIEARRW